MNVEKAA
jgi:Ca2+-binding EF-hand superfamily protein